MSALKGNLKEFINPLISLIILLIYYYVIPLHNFNYLLILTIMLLLNNIIYAIISFRKRILFMLFNIMIFVFLLSRPFIYMLRLTEWWNIYSQDANLVAMNSIIITLFFLMIGTILCEQIIYHLKKKNQVIKENNKNKLNMKLLQKVCLFVMIISMICFFVGELDKLLFMSNRAYEDIYSQYSSRIPLLIRIIGNFYHFSLFAYLATLPKKNHAFIALLTYIISGIPMLKIGSRNDFVLQLLFAFIYYFMRDNILSNGEKKWIGKIEKSLIIIMIPTMIIGLGAYNYIRSDEEFNFKPIALTTDFLFKQGTTYDTVIQGIHYEDQILGRNRNYTFGPLYDYFVYGKIGNILLGTDSTFLGGDGNNLIKAYNDSKFSHAISYTVMGSDYIAGHGRGSSYIIENYIDYGYAGVSIFSIFLGASLSWLCIAFKKNWFINTIILTIVSSVFLTPRETATFALQRITSYYFWTTIVGILILYYICRKFLNSPYGSDIIKKLKK